MRARVNERLARATRFPVTLIAAPAGFGKSVALRDFLASSGLSPVRYDVRREDGALLAFVRKLSEALATVAPSATAAFAAMQERVLATDEPVRQLSDWFAEHLKDATCTIVVEDLHYAATDPAAIALLSDIIERTNDRIKWIIAARSDVGLPIATWIAYGRMDIPIGEEDLRFTTAEALLAAAEIDAQFDPQEVESLRQLTDGWPVALTIALRTRTHSSDLRTASSGTRELVYRYLAEQVFQGLSPFERAFTLSTCVFPTFDLDIAQAFGAPPDVFAELRSTVTFLNELAPDQYRYHDLFRDFLETELLRSGRKELRHANWEGARILEARGDDAAALLLYAKAHATDDLLRLLERAGFTLLEHGAGDALSSALSALPQEVRQQNAVALGLHAMLESAHGHFELAEADFKAAISYADEPHVRAQLVLRYVIELVRQGRDCASLLEPYANDKDGSAEDRLPLLGTLATAYAIEGRRPEAERTIDRALAHLTHEVDDDSRARLFHQAAYVFQFSDPLRTERYAREAIRVALDKSLYGLAARAYSALYAIRYQADDATGSLDVLQRLDECARKCADSQVRLFGLMASYELAVERGDDNAITLLELHIREINPTFTLARQQALLPALALQAAWSGDFHRAYELRVATARAQTTRERQALRSSETSLYAVACGEHAEAERTFREAVDTLEQVGADSTRATLARLFLATTELMRAHQASAHRFLSEAEAASREWPRIRAFAHAVRVLYGIHLGQTDAAALTQAQQRLYSVNFGGIARLLCALPPPATTREGYMQLTPAEREILTLLATGASTKAIATRTARSPHTIDTHIRSICRKLQCSGRREAIALAAAAGWVHS